jgi:ribosomal protein S17
MTPLEDGRETIKIIMIHIHELNIDVTLGTYVTVVDSKPIDTVTTFMIMTKFQKTLNMQEHSMYTFSQQL